MNIYVGIGNLTRDVEVRVVNTGGKQTSVATFTLAITRRFQRKNSQEWSEHTDFIPCEAWDSGAERLGEKCGKGDRIAVEGRLKVNEWEKDGQRHSRMVVRVNRFSVMNRHSNKSRDNDDDGYEDAGEF